MGGRHRLKPPVHERMMTVCAAACFSAAAVLVAYLYIPVLAPPTAPAALLTPPLAQLPDKPPVVEVAPPTVSAPPPPISTVAKRPIQWVSDFGGTQLHVAQIGNFLKPRFNLRDIDASDDGLTLTLKASTDKDATKAYNCAVTHKSAWSITDTVQKDKRVRVSFKSRGVANDLNC